MAVGAKIAKTADRKKVMDTTKSTDCPKCGKPTRIVKRVKDRERGVPGGGLHLVLGLRVLRETVGAVSECSDGARGSLPQCPAFSCSVFRRYRLASVGISPSPSRFASAVTRVRPNTCAVAARNRSAGSPCGKGNWRAASAIS
jgi:hypothetical protein